MNPKFREIFEKIENDIRSGVYDKTRKLHSEEEYVAMYDVSRVTVRHAIDQLIRRGYCYPVQGKGVYLRRNSMIGAINLENVRGLSTDIAPIKVTSKVILFQSIVADSSLAEKMGIAIGAPLLYFERVRYADGLPLSIEKIHVDAVRIPVIPEALRNSFFDYIQNEIGIQINFIDYVIQAVKLDAHEAEILGLSAGDPGLSFDSLNMDRKGTIVLLAKEIYHYQRMRALKMASYL